MHRTYLKLLVVFAIGAGCRDTEHAGETGLLSFRFALTGCTSVAAGGRALAQGATVELVVSQNNSPPAGDLTVTSGSTEAISLAPASTGFFAAAATVTPACTGKSGSCETREAHVFMLANAVGTSRLAVSRSGIDLDALKGPPVVSLLTRLFRVF